MIRAGDERGQAMLEFALTSVIFLTLIFFVIDGGRILWQHLTVTQAASTVARYASFHGANSAADGYDTITPGNDARLKQLVLENATGLDPVQLTVHGTWQPNNEPGARVTVAIDYVTSPVVSLFWPNLSFTLHGEQTAVVQN
jgi:Flp pilus assembly protein TadG